MNVILVNMPRTSTTPSQNDAKIYITPYQFFSPFIQHHKPFTFTFDDSFSFGGCDMNRSMVDKAKITLSKELEKVWHWYTNITYELESSIRGFQ
jgi:hypothetical protein